MHFTENCGLLFMRGKKNLFWVWFWITKQFFMVFGDDDTTKSESFKSFRQFLSQKYQKVCFVIVVIVSKYLLLYLCRWLPQVGFQWHRRPQPLPVWLWHPLPITRVEEACPPCTLQDLHHKHTWLKSRRCSKVYTFISLSPSSRLAIHSPNSASRYHSPWCKLPCSLSLYHRHHPSPSLKANRCCLPKCPHHQCPPLHLCCLVVVLLHPQIALLLLVGHFAPVPHPLPPVPHRALLLLYLPVPKFTKHPPPLLFLWDRNETRWSVRPIWRSKRWT